MTPGKSKNEELYDFFEKIEKYIIDGESIEPKLHEVQSLDGCESLSKSWAKNSGNILMAKNICNIFVSIYNKLKGGRTNYRNESNYKTDFSFLNYWVNWKINSEFYNNNSISDFYNHIDSQDLLETTYDVSNNLIYDIDTDDLNKMNKLYNLYEKYSKLYAIIDGKPGHDKQQLLAISNACCPDYIEARYICNPDNNNNNNYINSKFCEKLKAFESKYEKLYPIFEAKRSEFSDNLIKLSECRNTKIITNALIGSFAGLIPLFGVLYKFTPMGQVIRTKIGMLNNNISNNDEEMTNISLVEHENEPSRFMQGSYNIKYQSL